MYDVKVREAIFFCFSLNTICYITSYGTVDTKHVTNGTEEIQKEQVNHGL